MSCGQKRNWMRNEEEEGEERVDEEQDKNC
jgi:hypothetical protein